MITAALTVLVAMLTPTAATATSGLGAAAPETQKGEQGKKARSGDKGKAPIAGKVKSALAAKGATDIWLVFGRSAEVTAELDKASEIRDWKRRGDRVVTVLKKAAAKSQKQSTKLLKKAKADYQSFWVSNRILVRDASTELTDRLSGVAGVQKIAATQVMPLVKPEKGKLEKTIQAVEWGIAAIKADQAWAQFGAHGEGIIVANNDTGVQYDHPALVEKYRGNNGDGTFDHNYNWFDPSSICSTTAPCDWAGHGSHTMGTMAGSDGENQIGVAPAVKWIAGMGCDVPPNGCSDFALMAVGQWMLEPRDLAGQNPRTDKRPHIVNNSWGGSNGSIEDPWYDDVLQAWKASGIYGVFSNGNSGPSCDTTGSPADSPFGYGVGGFQSNGSVYTSSSRGPGADDEIRPHISAPAVNVRSSVPNDAYDEYTGTSMAAPHVSGTIALMWSAAPALVGDIDTTKALLAQTAVDTDDTSCGGTPENNNVWGEGKLDALAAVEASPRDGAGTLEGTVTSAGDGSPVGNAEVKITGPGNRTLTTNADGTYAALLSVGDYTIEVSAFGYTTWTGDVTVTEGQTATRDVALEPTEGYAVLGVVEDARGNPLEGVTVTVQGTPLTPVQTAADGTYEFPVVPVGTYQLSVDAAACSQSATREITVDGREIVNFELPDVVDAFGYHCEVEASEYVEGDTALNLSGDDQAVEIELPFPVVHYGTRHTTAHASTNGVLAFGERSTQWTNTALPSSSKPNNAIYPFWDDLFMDGDANLYTRTIGTAPNRTFVVEWRDARIRSSSTARLDFEVVFEENGDVTFAYRNIDPENPVERGSSATIGFENADGTVGHQYALNTPVVADGRAVRFALPPNGLVSGTVVDRNDGEPVAGATVTLTDGSSTAREITTGEDGTYFAQLWEGSYDVTVSAPHYETETFQYTVSDGSNATKDVSLATARADVEAPTLSWVVPAGVEQRSTVSLGNSGSAVMTWSVTEGRNDVPWLALSPASGSLPVGGEAEFAVTVDSTGLTAGVHTATLVLESDSGRSPSIEIPVELVVSAYWKGVDVAGTAPSSDVQGLPWVADQEYREGKFGWTGESTVKTANAGVDIKETKDDALFRSQRQGMSGYRFDRLPAGTYEVRLDYAELARSPRVDWRMFDVSINGQYVQVAYDIADEVGGRTAATKTFRVTVAEGESIEVRFHARRAYQPPVVNGVRVVHRPDLS
ncbi:MAG TPA: carboxypeptidase regulatory-like domain-containing protein [Actinopolymorphaceae bacterium]